jgi:hypothetical protein
MRARFAALWLMLATAAAGCGSSTMSAADASPDGAPFCTQPLGDCSALPAQTPPNACTLDMAIAAACCQNCWPGALMRGARYTYVQFLNVDTAFVYVYDENQQLVARLVWSANDSVVGHPWHCTDGPADFDPSEVMSLLPVNGQGELAGMCPA